MSGSPNSLTEEKFRHTLSKAIASGDIFAVRALLSKEPLPWWVKPTHELKEAARQGTKFAANENDIEKMRTLLHEWSSDSSLPPLEAEDLEWSLGAAIKAGNRDIVRLLLKNGARANQLVTQ